jgi:hypothetical protein
MPSLLILALVLGAIGLFLVMPGGRTGRARVGLVTLAAAGGALAAGLCAGQDGRGLFAGCALVALFAAVRVITHKRPVYSALYLFCGRGGGGMLLLMVGNSWRGVDHHLRRRNPRDVHLRHHAGTAVAAGAVRREGP